jgi:hypothetical protein
MITVEHKDFPKIEWEQGDFQESHDHEKHYSAVGISEDGREWVGVWIEIDNNEVDIEYIEAA